MGEPIQSPFLPRVLISIEDKFGKSRGPVYPTLTVQDLIELGVVYVETDEMVLVEVPILTQKKLIETTKNYGFGIGRALDQMMRDMLNVFGIKGKAEMAVDEKLTWRAWQKKTQ